MVTSVCKWSCTLYKCCVLINVLLLALAIFVEVKSGNSSEVKDPSVSSSFQKELRWLIERVHPLNSSSTERDGVPKSSNIQSWESRNAFAAAENSLYKHVVKRSKDSRDRNFLKKMMSQIKEKEDASVQSALCSPSVDLAFVMDGCGRKPFHICINFIKDTIRKFKAFNNNTRVGVVVYSKKARLLFGFNYFTDTKNMLGALDSIRFMAKQPGKAENIGAALKKAQKMLFSGSRTGVQQVLILITGARANDDIIRPSTRLRQDGVIIYGVGFGNEFDRSQLETISSKPVQKHVFTDVRHLSNIFPWFLRNNLCTGKADVVKEGYIQRYQGPANVIFLLDGSGNIGFKEIQSYELFVKEVYNNIHIPPGGVKFGILECGTRHYSQENILTRTFEKSKMLDLTLNNLVPMNGDCELGKSLEMINMKVFKRLPEDAPKAVVVVMAGTSLDDATSVANELSDEGVRIVALGTGGQADMKQLISIADSPLYAFKVPLLKYLPSMATTVVGFINEVTEPKYTSNSMSSSKEPGVSDQETKAGFHNGFGDVVANDIAKGPNNDNNLLSGLRPILSELDGEDLGLDWSSLLQGEETQQDYPPPNQNIDLSQHPPNQQNDWNVGENQYATNHQEGSQFQASAINDDTQNVSGNISSNSQGNANVSPNNSSVPKPVSSNPESQNTSAATKPNQTGGNQANGTPGAVSAPNNGMVSNNGGANLGNGGSSGGPAGNNVGGNQGIGTPGAVTLPSVGVVPNSGGSNIANGGISVGASRNAANTPASTGQQAGPVQVIQTQLLPIPVLPVQTIPIQTLSPVQSQQGQVPASNPPPITQNQQQPVTNQFQIPQGKNNENTRNPNQTIPSTGPEAVKASQGSKGQETLASQTQTPSSSGQPTVVSPGPKVASNPAAKQPLPLTSPAPVKPPGEKSSPNTANSSKTQNTANSTLPHLSTPSPQNQSQTTPKPINASSVASNKTTSDSSAKGGPANANSSSVKPNSVAATKPTQNPTSDSSLKGGPANVSSSSVKPNSAAATKPTQKPQMVLCQIVCGGDCCPFQITVPTTKQTRTTPKTTLPPTSAKSKSKPKPTTPPEVIVAPPVPIGQPQGPEWFPQGAHPMSIGPISGPLSPPFSPMYMTLPPATASPVIGPGRFPQMAHSMPIGKMSGPLSSAPKPIYMTIPPATASPVTSMQEEKKEPLLVGQCQDYHPDCASFVMADMCDQQSPFKDAFNVREVCMLSCGQCNRFIKHGDKITFDVRDKGKKPEDIGFPEYSKKFLKRQVRTTQEDYEILIPSR